MIIIFRIDRKTALTKVFNICAPSNVKRFCCITEQPLAALGQLNGIIIHFLCSVCTSESCRSVTITPCKEMTSCFLRKFDPSFFSAWTTQPYFAEALSQCLDDLNQWSHLMVFVWCAMAVPSVNPRQLFRCEVRGPELGRHQVGESPPRQHCRLVESPGKLQAVVRLPCLRWCAVRRKPGYATQYPGASLLFELAARQTGYFSGCPWATRAHRRL